MFLAGLIVGCASTPRAEKTARIQKSCEGIATFLKEESGNYLKRMASSAPRSGELAAIEVSLFQVYDQELRQNAIDLDKATKSVAPSSCPDKAKLTQWRRSLEFGIPPKEATIKAEAKTEAALNAFFGKNTRFRWRLPGHAEIVTKEDYRWFLAGTQERSEREQLFKHFNSSRALRWQEWDAKDMLRLRNEEAKTAGFENYFEYALYRNQVDLGAYREFIDREKGRLIPDVARYLKESAERFGWERTEAWDLAFLEAKLLPDALDAKQAPNTETLSRRFFAGIGFKLDEGFESLSEPDMISGSFWVDLEKKIRARTRALYLASVRPSYSAFRTPGDVEIFAIEALLLKVASRAPFQEALLQEWGRKPASEAKPLAAAVQERAEMRAKIQQLEEIFRAELAHDLYKDPAQDFSETWAARFEEFWGASVPAFYADWDEGALLSDPTLPVKHMMANKIAEGLVKIFDERDPSVWTNSKLAEQLRAAWFEPGGELDYRDLFKRLTGNTYSDPRIW